MPTVLIAGASRGIGLELAKQYVAGGWRVHACCRHPEKVAAFKEAEGDLNAHRLDVTDGLKVAGLARELVEEPIDILVNNAGVYGPRNSFGNTDFKAWIEVLQVNTLAPLRLAERFVEHIARSQQRKLVNISSRMGSMACNESGGHYIYRTSKAALNMVTRSLSIDLQNRGVVVVAMHPGWVKTDMGGQAADLEPWESAEQIKATIDGFGRENSGRLYNYDGEELPW